MGLSQRLSGLRHLRRTARLRSDRRFPASGRARSASRATTRRIRRTTRGRTGSTICPSTTWACVRITASTMPSPSTTGSPTALQQTEAFNNYKDQMFGAVLTPSVKSVTWTTNFYLGQEHPDVQRIQSPGVSFDPADPGRSVDRADRARAWTAGFTSSIPMPRGRRRRRRRYRSRRRLCHQPGVERTRARPVDHAVEGLRRRVVRASPGDRTEGRCCRPRRQYPA